MANSGFQALGSLLFLLIIPNVALASDEVEFSEALPSRAESFIDLKLISKDPNDVHFYLFPDKL